ncbi:MAG: phosphatase PAP2 family protein [Thermoleophilia bacterium]
MKRKLSLRDSGMELTRSWRGALPTGGRDALRQFFLLLTCYAAYDVARVAVRGRQSVAMANAQGVINAEKALHVYIEPAVQTLASHVHVLVEFMDWFYGSVHLPATILVLVWIYLYRNETFAFFRNVFLTMNVLAMAIFALLPVAPPRLVPTSGVVDTLYLYSTSNYHSGILSFVTDQYAALPSLHIGYAVFVSLAIYLLTTNRLARVLAAVYPVVVLAAIIITGNHYVIDAVAGVIVLAVAFVANYGIAPQSVPEAITVYSRGADE